MNIYKKDQIPTHLLEYFEPAEIGSEQTPEQYVTKMVEVMREARRVMREDGTLWLNIGDSYASSSKKGTGDPYRKTSSGKLMPPQLRAPIPDGCKKKDLIGIPWMLAFALRADGWYLRQDIIWEKPNVMPESVTDRCTKSHEYVFLLTKSPKYHFDANAIKVPAKVPGDTRHLRKDTYKESVPLRTDGGSRKRTGNPTGKMRNRRSVWSITTKPYRGAHFAPFPPDLVRPCILAGCPEGGTVLDPFGGSGTTGQVAKEHGRNAILIELNPDYIKLAKERCGEI